MSAPIGQAARTESWLLVLTQSMPWQVLGFTISKQHINTMLSASAKFMQVFNWNIVSETVKRSWVFLFFRVYSNKYSQLFDRVFSIYSTKLPWLKHTDFWGFSNT